MTYLTGINVTYSNQRSKRYFYVERADDQPLEDICMKIPQNDGQIWSVYPDPHFSDYSPIGQFQ